MHGTSLLDFRLLAPSRSDFFWVVTRRMVIVVHRRFGIVCQFHFKGQAFQPLVFERGAIDCPETLVNQQHTMHRKEEERIPTVHVKVHLFAANCTSVGLHVYYEYSVFFCQVYIICCTGFVTQLGSKRTVCCYIFGCKEIQIQTDSSGI